MSFNPHFSWDFLSEDEIEIRTIRAIKNHILFLKQDSKYYGNKLTNITPDNISNYDDIKKIPITPKEDLSKYIEQFWVANEEDVVEKVVTSGSTGSPLVVPLTKSDLDRLAYNESLSFHSAGVSPSDTAFIMVSLDRLFVAGMAYYRGLTALGASTSRIGVLPPEMQKHYMELLKPTVLVGVPSYLIKLGRFLIKENSKEALNRVNKIFCIGEPIREEDMSLNSSAIEIEEIFNAEVYSTYASTEVASTFCDCTDRTGAHSHPEILYAEILDENGNEVKDGEVGELVVTPFGIEGLPLLRYRTGDITQKIIGKCTCGRNSTRIGPILSRKSQLLKVKGTTIYPLTITNVLDSMDNVEDYIIEITGRTGSPSEEIYIYAATPPSNVNIIMSEIQASARVIIQVLISNKATLRSMRGGSAKKLKIVDNRT